MSDSQEREEAAGPSETLRPESAAYGCETMKNYINMDIHGSPTHCHERSQTNRSPSPVPSCVSMKSDVSMHNPLEFSSGPAVHSKPESQTYRLPSSVVSYGSMKSDVSKHNPPEFSSGPAEHSKHDDQFEDIKLSNKCDICIGNLNNAAKYCTTCKASYCVTHLADHYKTPAFTPHKLVRHNQKPKVSLEKVISLQWSRSGTAWMLLMILSVLVHGWLFWHVYHQFPHSEGPVELPQLRVMLLGKTGAGKSASGNTILGREAFKSEASALPVTKYCKSQSGVVEGRNVTVIDTPGITRECEWLLENEAPHVFLLVIPLGRFTEEDSNEVKWIQNSFGEDALKFTIVLFTGGDQMKGKSVEEFLNESSGLQTLVKSVGGRYHIFNNRDLQGHQQVKELLEKIEVFLRKSMGYSFSHGLHEQILTLWEQERKRLKLDGCSGEAEQGKSPEFYQVMKNMERRREWTFKEQMKRKITLRIANAAATLNKLRENIKSRTELSLSGPSLQTLLIGFMSGLGVSGIVLDTMVKKEMGDYLKWLFLFVLAVILLKLDYLTLLVGFMSGVFPVAFLEDNNYLKYFFVFLIVIIEHILNYLTSLTVVITKKIAFWGSDIIKAALKKICSWAPPTVDKCNDK
ncbi:uncharacterized protein LOC143123306 isoform X2 [Alosa pseudoharengus]